MKILRLGVNIDHVATIRNARGGSHPDPVRAATIAAKAGADGITAHLREDRRHIRDEDIERLLKHIDLPLNLEMAATQEMFELAMKFRPHACCIVPEKREELTTEGGLDVAGAADDLAYFIRELRKASIRVSLFIDAEPRQIEAAVSVGAQVVELHTGRYCERAIDGDAAAVALELDRIAASARQADSLGLEVHAGHGLTFDTVAGVAALPEIVELNIGHFLVGEAIYGGLDSTIKRMRDLMSRARTRGAGQIIA